MRVLAELFKKAIEPLIDDVQFGDGTLNASSRHGESASGDSLLKFGALSVGATDNNPALISRDSVAASRLEPPDSPTICEVSTDNPPEGFAVPLGFDFRTAPSGKVVCG
jgi:hypothetical protein